jgi:beta-1,4-mannooligosaccharide/beta-1,4-mannosyl-N-acetylglucosamine phosphorylase
LKEEGGYMSEPIIGSLKSSPVIKRYPQNPVLSSKDVPYKSALVFNPGVARHDGKYVMVFRNDYGSLKAQRIEGTHIGLALSDNGIGWEVQSKPCFTLESKEIIHIYDPHLTIIEGKCYMCFAMDTFHGARGCIAVTEDFEDFEILTMTAPDNRNLVLFPEKFDNMFVRLERPFPAYSRGKDRFDIWISDSPDLKYWGNSQLLIGVEDVPFANNKIGPGTPPVKTHKGWLTIFHSVDLDPNRGKNGWEETWKKRYSAGIMLLDLEDPRKVIGVYREPLMAPEAPYEVEGGYRNNVIFPTGIIQEKSGEIKIYYGAADTVVCLATAHVDDLLNLCTIKS